MHADLFICLWGNSVRVERGWLPGSTDDFSVGQVERLKWEQMPGLIFPPLDPGELNGLLATACINHISNAASALNDFTNFARRS